MSGIGSKALGALVTGINKRGLSILWRPQHCIPGFPPILVALITTSPRIISELRKLRNDRRRGD